tara:strand:+ start:437 stop:763 length:327 start_codon:yes stop_codon:yes gene_type:complete
MVSRFLINNYAGRYSLISKREVNMKYLFLLPLLLILGCSGDSSSKKSTIKTKSVDICECLNNASYYNNNENDCDNKINKELGHNWKTTNYSKEPSKSAKFDALAERCN